MSEVEFGDLTMYLDRPGKPAVNYCSHTKDEREKFLLAVDDKHRLVFTVKADSKEAQKYPLLCEETFDGLFCENELLYPETNQKKK